MLGLTGFSGSLPLCVTITDIICMFINLANKDACLLDRTKDMKLTIINS